MSVPSGLVAEGMIGLGAAQQNIRVKENTHQCSRPSYMASRLTASSDRRGVGRWLADHASNAAARSSGDNRFFTAGSTVPSTTNMTYSCTLIPFAYACASSPTSTSGLNFKVTVIASLHHLDLILPWRQRVGLSTGKHFGAQKSKPMSAPSAAFRAHARTSSGDAYR